MKQNLTFEEDNYNYLDKNSYQQHVQEINRLTQMINSNMFLDKAELYYKKGMNLFVIKNHEEAVQSFNKATNIDKNHAEAYFQKGQIFRTFLKDPKAAVNELDEAIRINPKYVEAYNCRGYALMDLHKYEDAAESFDKIIRINQENNRICPYSILEQLYFCDGYQGKASALQELGRWEEVLEIYNHLIKQKPNYEHHHHDKAKALLFLNRIEEALDSINKALIIQPDNPLFLFTKGQAVALSRNRKATEEFFNQSLQQKSKFFDSASTYLEYGLAMDILGDKVEAIRNFDLAIQDSPDYYQAYYRKGLILISLGEKMKALDCFNKAIKINPDYIEAYNAKGLMLSELGQNWEAIKCYNKVIKMNPNDAHAYNNKGWFLSQEGDYESGLECINHSLEINPKIAHTHHSKGFALSALGRQKEAIECYNKAIELDNQLICAHSDKGMSYLLLKEYSLAIECFDKALSFDANYTQAQKGKIQAEKLLF